MLGIRKFLLQKREKKHFQIMFTSKLYLVWAIPVVLFEFFSPLYLDYLGFNFLIIGIIISGSSFISFFIDPFLGYLQKRFYPKTLFLISILLFFINIILFIFSGKIIFLLFLAANLYGIAFDLYNITSYRVIFENSIDCDRSTNISYLESHTSFGLLVGAVIAGFIMSDNIKNAAYASLIILFFLAIIVFFQKSIKKDTKKIKPKLGYGEIKKEMMILGKKGFFLIFLLIFIHLFDGFFFVFEPLFAKKFEGYFFNEYVIGGLLLAIYNLPVILLAPLFGKLADKFGRKKLFIIGFAIAFISLFALRATNGLLLSALAIFGVSLGFFGVSLPALEGIYESITEKKFGASLRGMSISIMEITLSLGFLFGPLIGGIFLEISGNFNLAFMMYAIATFILGVISLYSLKEK